MPTEIHDAQKHPKQDFQVERLAFFSDAVFAIAITLLIIDFKVPEINSKSTQDEVWQQLVKLTPNIISLLVSFYFIATYWIRHHFLFKHIHNYNKQIVVINLVVLLPIIFLPFTTAFVANAFAVENREVTILALRIFLANHILVNLSIYMLYWIAMVLHKEFSFHMVAKEKVRFTMDTLFQTIFLTAGLAILFIPNMKQHRQWILGIFAIVAVLKFVLEKILKMRFTKEEALN
jgi:uncharacterized membrane protein